MALAQRKTEATAARLSGLQIPASGAWLDAARRAALGRVRSMGLPAKRDEYWRFTDPGTLTSPEVIPAPALAGADEGVFDAINRIRITFVDGVFDAARSDDLKAAGLEIERLSDAAQSDLHWAREVYGRLEERGQTPVERPLAALNSALAEDGVLIRVNERVSKPVHLLYLHKSDSSDVILHHCVKIEAGADLTLLESGPAAARLSSVLEVDIGDGAGFHHLRAQGRDLQRRAATHCFARLGAESTFKSFTLTAHGALTRNECVIELSGNDAVAHVAGVAIGDGRDVVQDDTVFITHDAVGCESRQVFKKVLRNGATGVFQGKILVKPGAQKTDGYQKSQSLLLDEDSQFLAKPELEIYADDVACSHGSTSGAIDETALFYLRSRGVPLKAATDLLTLAFLSEALDEIENPHLSAALQTQLEAWLGRR